ncbi:MAG: hypothetical protein VYD99_05775, partial [Planctomycetota bacterium]|nr:hypothetical protein [Planctomycetota bacterium]
MNVARPGFNAILPAVALGVTLTGSTALLPGCSLASNQVRSTRGQPAPPTVLVEASPTPSNPS